MRKIRIDFCDFHPGYNKTKNFFYNLLSERFEIELCDQPDFLIYSAYGHEHRLQSGVRIFFSGESAPPDFRECDYALTWHYLDDARHLRSFPDEDALIEKIIELDRDDAKYLEYVRQPYFHADQPNVYFSRQRLLDFFEKIFSAKIKSVAHRRKWFQLGRWMFVKRHHLGPPP